MNIQNLLLLTLLWIKLNYYYWRHSKFFIQKFFGFFVSLIYLLEYIFLFFFINNYIYLYLIYKFVNKENIIKKKKWDFYYETEKKNYKKIKNKKTMSYKILNIYKKKWMFLGVTKIYLQIIWRKIKEVKNYIIHYFNLKIKYKYFLLKKKIMNYSFFFFLNNNYNLLFFLEILKKKFYNFFLILNFIVIQKKVKIKLRFFFFINYICNYVYDSYFSCNNKLTHKKKKKKNI